MELFAPLPDDLASLTDEELSALHNERLSLVERIAAQDAELIGEMTAGEVLAEMTRGVEQVEQLRSEQAGRDSARAEVTDEIAQLAARVGLAQEETLEASTEEPPDDGDDEDGDGEEAEAHVEAEAIVAAAPRTRPYIARAPRHEPQPRDEVARNYVITASADIPGVSSGAELREPRQIAEAMISRRQAIKSTPEGMREDIPVVRITRRYDEDHVLSTNEDDSSRRLRALAASGGLCAPETPYYEFMQLSVADRPVRDSLPRFNAARGGIRYAAPPGISAITTGVGTMTAANDAIGGTTATKTSQHISCPSILTVDVDMIYHSLQFGNLGARTWPEQVENFIELAMAAQASTAETKLLNAIKTGSTLVTVASSQLGYVGSLLTQIITAGTGYRSRHRMDPNATLRVMLPAWAVDGLVVDLMRSAFHRFEPSRQGVVAFLESQGFAATFYIDSATESHSQIFPSQGAGALQNFPIDVDWYLFAEGSWLFLDAGTLDLGIVRDSTLNNTNDYSVFGETFENVAFIGLESLHVQSTVYPDGTVAAAATVTHPTI